MAKLGRPSTFRKRTAATICERLAAGETLRAICRDEGMPAASTVLSWALNDTEGFSEQYTKAREIGYRQMADELLDIADDTSGDTIKGTDGQPDRADHEWISRSRLRVDTRKWLLSKALPKIYGDKLAIEATHHHDAETLTDAQLADIIAGRRGTGAAASKEGAE